MTWLWSQWDPDFKWPTRTKTKLYESTSYYSTNNINNKTRSHHHPANDEFFMIFFSLSMFYTWREKFPKHPLYLFLIWGAIQTSSQNLLAVKNFFWIYWKPCRNFFIEDTTSRRLNVVSYKFHSFNIIYVFSLSYFDVFSW